MVGIDNINCELAPSDIYSGMYGRVTIRFFGYSNSGNKGIGCGLGNVLKTRDGEPLSGQASAASDFCRHRSRPHRSGPQLRCPRSQLRCGPPCPPTPRPWNGGNGINPITGQPM